MEISDVDNLAKLAKLDLNKEEKEEILSDMDGILKYIKQIEEVETGDMRSDDMVHNVWREDEETREISRDFSRDLIIEQFPDKQGDFLKVKKIL